MDSHQFWSHLEYRVSVEIEGLRVDDFRGVWCDGFVPEMFQVFDGCPSMTGRVWLAKAGRGGLQEQWRFVLRLPASVRSEQDIDWAAILSPLDATGWLTLDISQRLVKVDPGAAYPDQIEPNT